MSDYKDKLTLEEMEYDDMEMSDIEDWGEYEKEREEEMKNMKPDILVAVHINKEGKIEDSEILACFHVGEDKFCWDEEVEVMDYQGFHLQKGVKPNTLYHVYMHVRAYRCSYEYDEWDTEHYYLHIIPVIENYEEHLAAEADFQEQELLKLDNCRVPGIVIDKDFYGKGEDLEDERYTWSHSTTTNLTYNDLKRMVRKMAEADIHLAHRIYNGWGLTDMLGEYYNPDIEVVEKKRLGFRSFLTGNYNRKKDHKVKLTQDGYKLPKTHRYEEFTITHEEIDELPSEWLMDLEYDDILKQIFEAKKVSQRLLKAKK